MNKAIKKKWLRALRSGEYVQGRNQLVTEGVNYDKFCCLGVLVNETEGFGIKKNSYFFGPFASSDPDEIQYTCGNSFDTLSVAFRRRVGLSADDTFVLMDMNDIARKNFKTIANWIERNL